MHPNVKKLMEAGLLNVKDAGELPPDLLDKISRLSDKDIDALKHLKQKVDPELLKTYNQFIFI